MREGCIAKIFENSADKAARLWVNGLTTDDAFNDTCSILMYGGDSLNSIYLFFVDASWFSENLI
jgi:hypothetical protein